MRRQPPNPYVDLLHPNCYPGLITPTERPEPYYGTLKIVNHCPTVDHRATAVQYDDGRYDIIANGFVPDGHDVHNNGPMFAPGDCGIRGDISNSEGMDWPNYVFNNTDNGASF